MPLFAIIVYLSVPVKIVNQHFSYGPLITAVTDLFVALKIPPKGGWGCLMSPPCRKPQELSFDSTLQSPLCSSA